MPIAITCNKPAPRTPPRIGSLHPGTLFRPLYGTGYSKEVTTFYLRLYRAEPYGSSTKVPCATLGQGALVYLDANTPCRVYDASMQAWPAGQGEGDA